MGVAKVAEQHTYNLADTNGILLAAATFNSGARMGRGYAEVFGHGRADQAGTVFVEQGRDGTNWDISDSQAVAINQTVRWNISIKARYVRIRWVNGAVNQTAFRMYCSFIRIRSPAGDGFQLGPVGGAPGSSPQTARSDKDSHFTGALATNAQEQENLTGLASNSIRIQTISFQADQNLDWDIMFFATDGFEDADLDLDTFIERVRLPVSLGVQIAGGGQFYYSLSGLDIPYRDADSTNELHVALVNRNAVAKNAGATGEVVLEVTYVTE